MNLPKMEVPTFSETIPSTNKKIKIRPFLVKEHKAMMMMDSTTSDEVVDIIKQIVDSCSFNAIDVDTLAHFDLTYLFLKLREKSIGENVDIVVECECGHKNPASINLKDVVVKKPEGHKNKFDLGVSDSGLVGVEMQYPTLEDVVLLYDNPSIENLFMVTQKSIKAIYTDDSYVLVSEVSDDVFVEWFDSLSKDQLDKIEHFFQTIPRVYQEVDVTCSECGKDIHHTIEGIENFFV